eukprot:GHVQ01042116.1.p3 GENE.GHVQ01042116.1~~GHVQ01042116.1.p3  ORF type:complete len:146 (-),score=11.21 GHVQ01042116.1:442-879(-)
MGEEVLSRMHMLRSNLSSSMFPTNNHHMVVQKVLVLPPKVLPPGALRCPRLITLSAPQTDSEPSLFPRPPGLLLGSFADFAALLVISFPTWIFRLLNDVMVWLNLQHPTLLVLHELQMTNPKPVASWSSTQTHVGFWKVCGELLE